MNTPEIILVCVFIATAAIFWWSIFCTIREIWRAIRLRRYDRAAQSCVLVIVLLWAGLFLRLTPGATAYADYRRSRCMFGRYFDLGEPRLSWHSDRYPNGDGYSISVFEASDALIHWASFPPPDYPVLPFFSTRWSVIRWRSTPVVEDRYKLLEFALLGRHQAHNEDLQASTRLLERLAKEEGNYFACCYQLHGNHVGDLDFYLLSPSERVLIVVSNNT